jgi:CubicO group peptidase (beta-lactamase class C family)
LILARALAVALVLATAAGIFTGPGDTAPAFPPGPAVASAAAAGATAAEDSALAASIARYLERLEAFGFSGAVLAGRGAEVIHASGHGTADREDRRGFTTGTVSSLGSITKVYTAAAILRLVARGDLSLADTLGAFVPELPADRSGISLWHLLTHTSGLGEAPYGDEDPVSRELLLDQARALPLQDEPGTNHSYSNLGFSLLGVVLEEATGLPYEEAMMQEVLWPIGAWETGYTLAGWGPERLAAGYERGVRWGTVVEKYANPDGGPSWILRGNGGFHATVFDVFRFVRAYFAGAIVSPAQVSASIEPQGRFERQGLGWALDVAPDGSAVVGHDGSNGYLTASVQYLPGRDISLIVLANVAEFTAADVGRGLLRIATGADVPIPPEIAATPLSAAQRDAFSGAWELDGGLLSVEDAGDFLMLHVEGQEVLDRVLEPDTTPRVRFAGDNERARAVVDAAQRGDFGGRAGLARVWTGLESRMGPIDSVAVLGSAPVWYASPRASWLRLHFRGERRTQIRRLHWDADGTLYGIGGSVYPAPVSLRCVGTGPADCTAMHLQLEVAPVEFRLRGKDAAELRVGDRVLTARRTRPPARSMP